MRADRMIEAGNPEWFIWQGDQGYLPKDEVERMLVEFAEKVMPHNAGTHAPAAARAAG